MPFKDPDELRAYRRKWYFQNKLKVLSKANERYYSNRESRIAYSKKYRLDNLHNRKNMNNKIDDLYDSPIPDGCRGFFDPTKLRGWIKEYATDSYEKALNKIETPDYKLSVKEIEFEDPDKRFTLKDQKNALLERRDLTLPLKGTFELIDKRSGQVIDKKRTTIAHVPYVTDRNTAIINGSEYVTTNQQRLKPGVYTRIKDSGEVEAHVNVRAGTGAGGKLIFYPEKAVFVYKVGSTEIKLYGLLHDLGMPDSVMEKAWGKEIFLKNKATYDGMEIDKLHNKIFTTY